MSLIDQMDEDLKRALGEMPLACKFGEVEFTAGRASFKVATNNGELGVTETYEMSIRAPLSEFTAGLPEIDNTIEVIGDKSYNIESLRKDTVSIFLNLGKLYT